jgi:uncharacterized protein (DUF934 family)
MPRRLLRDRQIVVDDWRYAAEASELAPAGDDAGAVILNFDQWRAERDHWIVRGGRLGVVLLPAHSVESLAADLPRLSLVAAHFLGPSEGRGYTQARLLRERYGFTGELRATGYVRTDQLFFMARCGFNSFEMAEGDLAAGLQSFASFSSAYQVSNDAGLALKLQLP